MNAVQIDSSLPIWFSYTRLVCAERLQLGSTMWGEVSDFRHDKYSPTGAAFCIVRLNSGSKLSHRRA